MHLLVAPTYPSIPQCRVGTTNRELEAHTRLMADAVEAVEEAKWIANDMLATLAEEEVQLEQARVLARTMQPTAPSGSVPLQQPAAR